MADLRGRVPDTPANSLWSLEEHGLGEHGLQQLESRSKLGKQGWNRCVPPLSRLVPVISISAFAGSLTADPGAKAQVKTVAVLGAVSGAAMPLVLGLPPVRPPQPSPRTKAQARQPWAVLPAGPAPINLPAPRPIPSVHSLGQRMPVWPGGAWETGTSAGLLDLAVEV